MTAVDLRTCCALVLLLCTGAAGAQPVPDASATLRDMDKRWAPSSTPNSTAAAVLLERKAVPASGAVRLDVRAFEVRGATSIKTADLVALLQPWLGSGRTFDDLSAAAAAVAEAYRARGVLATAVYPAQDVTDGVVTLQVIESRLGRFRLSEAGEGHSTSDADGLVARTLMAAQSPGQPIHLAALERATRLVAETPGMDVRVRLVAGAQDGETDIWAEALNRPHRQANLTLDNLGDAHIGGTTWSGMVAWDNVAGRGESLQLLGQGSQGMRAMRGLVSEPVGADGWRWGAEVTVLHYELVGDFSALAGEGDIRSWSTWAQYPVLRAPGGDLTFRGELGQHRARNGLQGAPVSEKRGEHLLLGWDWRWRGGSLFPQSSSLRLQTKLGRLDLAGVPSYQAADAAGPRTEGRFAKLQLTFSGTRPLGSATDFQLTGAGQWAPKNLDAAEQINVIGPYAVRAFAGSGLAGDVGFYTRWDLIQRLHPTLELSAFLDQGWVRLRRLPGPDAAALRNHLGLWGFGAGMRWAAATGTDVQAELAHGVASDAIPSLAGAKRIRLWVRAQHRF